MEHKLTPRELKRIESDKRIIDATIDVVGRKGYTNANIRDIAKQAEVTPGLVMQRFETKEQLLIQAIYATDEMWRGVKIPEDTSAYDLLVSLITHIKKTCIENKKAFDFLYMVSNSTDIPLGVIEMQKEVFYEGGIYDILKNAQEEGYLPEGDLAVLYNIYICNSMHLIRDYNRAGLPIPRDDSFLSMIQYGIR